MSRQLRDAMLLIFIADTGTVWVPVEMKGTFGTCVVASACFLSSHISKSCCTLSCSSGERKFSVPGILLSSAFSSTVSTGAPSSASIVINYENSTIIDIKHYIKKNVHCILGLLKNIYLLQHQILPEYCKTEIG